MPIVKIANIGDNMYRDRELFPTDPSKIATLIESINQTGFWDNIMVRIKFNELADGTIITDHAHLTSLMNAKKVADRINLNEQKFELAYGHHRLDALIEAGYTEIDIPVKYITDEDMMRIMANENKEGWGSSIKSLLETVRQVDGQLQGLFSDYAGYTDYLETVGADKAVFSKKQFQEAKLNGIGYRTIQQFLGDSWNPTDVRIPMAVFKAVEKGYFALAPIYNFPSLGILDAFTSCVVALYEGGKIKEKVEVEKKDKDGKTMRDGDGNPIMVKQDKFVTVAGPVWPPVFKAKMVAALMEQCMLTETTDERGDEIEEYVKETLLTQSEINKRRVNMLKKMSAPTTSGAAEYRLKKEIIRAYFPSFDPKTPDEERLTLHAQLIGKDMDAFKAEDGIKDWFMLDGMVADLEEDFKCLLTPLAESAAELQAEMEPDQGTSQDYESEYKDLEIAMDDVDEEGVKVAKPIGQVSRDVVDLLNVAMTGVEGLTDRAEEIDLDTDELLHSSVRITIAKACKLYAMASSTDDLGFLLKEIMEALTTLTDSLTDPKQ